MNAVALLAISLALVVLLIAVWITEIKTSHRAADRIGTAFPFLVYVGSPFIMAVFHEPVWAWELAQHFAIDVYTVSSITYSLTVLCLRGGVAFLADAVRVGVLIVRGPV